MRDCARCGEPFEKAIQPSNVRGEFLMSLSSALEVAAHQDQAANASGRWCPRDFDEDGNLVVLPGVDDSVRGREKAAALFHRADR